MNPNWKSKFLAGLAEDRRRAREAIERSNKSRLAKRRTTDRQQDAEARAVASTAVEPVGPTAADLEFERVKAAALARIAAEQRVAAETIAARQAAQAAEDLAVASIINALAATRAHLS